MKTKVKFPKEPDFFYKDLCKEVQDYFKNNNITKYGNNALVFKYLIIKIATVLSFVAIFYFQDSYLVFLPFILLGPLGVIMAINISHDAIHGVAHSNKWINSYFTIQMDLIGPNSYVWKKRHQFGHHTFPNTLGKDPDLTQMDVVKVLPEAPHKSYHKYQHLYAPFLYALYTLNWIYVRDFTDFFSKKSEIKNIPKKEYIKLIAFKLVYISIFILMPIFFTSLSVGEVLLGNVLLHFSASYFLTIALVASHVSETSVFITPDSDGKMPYSWSHHQVLTTADFATNSNLTTWLLGGFNHHIAHHLFPKCSHVHYSKMTPIIKRLTKKYGLKYNHEGNILKAYLSHYNLLKNNSLQFSNAEMLYYKELITNRFVRNPRMSLLFNKEKHNFRKNIFELVSYCFHIALKANGVYVANNKKTIVLFYENAKLKKSFSDYLQFLKVIKGVPISNFKRILKNEKEIKRHKLKLDNYIYVWFIAQEEGYGKLDGLQEVNEMLFKLSKERNIPILFETSDIRLLRFYKYVGFDTYDKLVGDDETIYFFADKKTIESHKNITND